jgi:hypothetical protein
VIRTRRRQQIPSDDIERGLGSGSVHQPDHRPIRRIDIDSDDAISGGESDGVAADAAVEVADDLNRGQPLGPITRDDLAGRLLKRFTGEVHPIGTAELAASLAAQQDGFQGGSGQIGGMALTEMVEAPKKGILGRVESDSLAESRLAGGSEQGGKGGQVHQVLGAEKFL